LAMDGLLNMAGEARLGVARIGRAGHGKAGMEWKGKARLGAA